MLVDARAVGSLGEASDRYLVKGLESAELKGFARPVAIFTVARCDAEARAGPDVTPTRSRAPGRD